jgi:hypothetical protein
MARDTEKVTKNMERMVATETIRTIKTATTITTPRIAKECTDGMPNTRTISLLD